MTLMNNMTRANGSQLHCATCQPVASSHVTLSDAVSKNRPLQVTRIVDRGGAPPQSAPIVLFIN